MPGVTIVEAMTQTAGVMVGASMGLTGGNLLIYFMAIDGCKFRRKVVPGDVLEMHVTTKRGGGKVWKFSGRAEVDPRSQRRPSRQGSQQRYAPDGRSRTTYLRDDLRPLRDIVKGDEPTARRPASEKTIGILCHGARGHRTPPVASSL